MDRTLAALPFLAPSRSRHSPAPVPLAGTIHLPSFLSLAPITPVPLRIVTRQRRGWCPTMAGYPPLPPTAKDGWFPALPLVPPPGPIFSLLGGHTHLHLDLCVSACPTSPMHLTCGCHGEALAMTQVRAGREWASRGKGWEEQRTTVPCCGVRVVHTTASSYTRHGVYRGEDWYGPNDRVGPQLVGQGTFARDSWVVWSGKRSRLRGTRSDAKASRPGPNPRGRACPHPHPSPSVAHRPSPVTRHPSCVPRRPSQTPLAVVRPPPGGKGGWLCAGPSHPILGEGWYLLSRRVAGWHHSGRSTDCADTTAPPYATVTATALRPSPSQAYPPPPLAPLRGYDQK